MRKRAVDFPHYWSECVRALRAQSSFRLTLVTNGDYAKNESLPAHRKVLRPLLAAASECIAYDVGSEFLDAGGGDDIFLPFGRRYRLDLRKELITGHEPFWNAPAGHRGSVLILLPTMSIREATEIFRYCYSPYVVTNLRNAYTAAAVRAARTQASNSHIAFLLSKSNGIQWLHVFAPRHQLRKLFRLAATTCVVPPSHYYLYNSDGR